MSFDVNILVNGSRCKQYQHCGRTYIQANPGSEYTLEIKNNYWKRILAVSSVDGLNVLTGKTASEEDTGYIIDSYSSEKIKGFRISDTEWALFKFGYKFNGNTYAQSKEDGSEKNCGVIGFRFFYEEEPMITYTTTTITTTSNCSGITSSYALNSLSADYALTGNGGLYGNGKYGYTSHVNYSTNNLGTVNYNAPFGGNPGGRGMSSGPIGISNSQPMMNLSYGENVCNSAVYSREMTKGGGQSATNYCSTVQQLSCETEPSPELFDVGTEFGRKETSKVKNVDFHRGCLAQSFDIYYASRDALIRMGIPMENVLQSNYVPQSFPNKYATPPKNWVG